MANVTLSGDGDHTELGQITHFWGHERVPGCSAKSLPPSP